MKDVDKSKFKPGPWMHEPDIIAEDKDGYRLLVVRQRAGFLCGYVGVDKNHSLYEKLYMSPLDENVPDGDCLVDIIDVHGGLTYSGFFDSIEEAGNYWYFGFDCGHYTDHVPNPILRVITSVNRYKDVAYVKNEIDNMLKQIKDIENES